MSVAGFVKLACLVALPVALIACREDSYAAEPQGKPEPLTTLKPDIIGGTQVSPWQSPWQVALIWSTGSPVDGVFCGGTLIDSKWVLTAAHCFFEKNTCAKIPKQAIFVGYGSTDLGKKISLIASKELYYPNSYSCASKAFDIGLIELDEPVNVASFAQLATGATALPLIAPGTHLMTSGWGLTKVDGWKSRYLMEVEIPVVHSDQCEVAYGKTWPKGDICAGEVGKDACTGDSGGPLYRRQGKDQAIQVGVVSFGDSCGKAKSPGAYTPVAEHLAWIQETRKPKPCTAKDVAENRC